MTERVCLICGHEPCEYCQTWCDLVAHQTDEKGDVVDVITCCESECVYTWHDLRHAINNRPYHILDAIMAAAAYRGAEGKRPRGPSKHNQGG